VLAVEQLEAHVMRACGLEVVDLEDPEDGVRLSDDDGGDPAAEDVEATTDGVSAVSDHGHCSQPGSTDSH